MHSDNTPKQNVRLIRLAEVKRRTGLSTSSIYLALQRGEFPRRVKLNAAGTMVGWVESEIDQYVLERIAERDRCEAGTTEAAA
jgi:prophage regulatory protein